MNPYPALPDGQQQLALQQQLHNPQQQPHNPQQQLHNLQQPQYHPHQYPPYPHPPYHAHQPDYRQTTYYAYPAGHQVLPAPLPPAPTPGPGPGPGTSTALVSRSRPRVQPEPEAKVPSVPAPSEPQAPGPSEPQVLDPSEPQAPAPSEPQALDASETQAPGLSSETPEEKEASASSADVTHSVNQDVASGCINPLQLTTGFVRQPRFVFIDIEGDVGEYLAKVPRQLVSEMEENRTTQAFDSVCVTDGCPDLRMGFTTDYYGYEEGRSSSPLNALTWDPVGDNPHSTKTTYLCQLCGILWKGKRIPNKFFREKEPDAMRKKHWIKQEFPNNGGYVFRRHNPLEWYYWIDTDADPVRGWLIPDPEPRLPCIRDITYWGSPPEMFPERGPDEPPCCPPPIDRRLLGNVKFCPMDNCEYMTLSLAEFTKHLMYRSKKRCLAPEGHPDFLNALIKRIRGGQWLEDWDLEVSYRLQYVYNDCDLANKQSPSLSSRTALRPDQMTNPAVLAEHRAWVEQLSPTVFKTYDTFEPYDPSMTSIRCVRHYIDPDTNAWCGSEPLTIPIDTTTGSLIDEPLPKRRQPTYASLADPKRRRVKQ